MSPMGCPRSRAGASSTLSVWSRLLCLSALLLFVACQPPKGLVGGEPDTGTSSGEEDTGACDVYDDVSLPAALYVQVVDGDDTPLEGARVTVAGHGERTGPSGEASFPQLLAGDATIWVATSDGRDGSKAITLVEGSIQRVVVVVGDAGETTLLNAAIGAVLEQGDASLVVNPDALAAADGSDPTGEVTLEWRVGSASAEDAGPGSELGAGIDADGARVHLALVAATELRAVDALGRPLRVGDGRTLDFSQVVTTDDAEDACSCLSAWVLDPWTGLWVERSDVEVTAFVVNGEIGIAADLPSTGPWAFGSASAPACLDVQIDDCAGLTGLPLEVQVQGSDGALRRVLSHLDMTPSFGDLGEGPVEVSLLANETVLATTTVSVEPGDTCSSVVLSPSICEGLAVAVRTDGQCPADGATLRLTQTETSTSFTTDVDRLATLSSLSEGTWSVALLDDSGDTLDEADATVRAGALSTLVLSGSGLDAVTPPGGCFAPPCGGDDCDACLVVDVTEPDGSAASDIDVDVCDLIPDESSTEADGETCLDLPDSVGTVAVFSAAGGWPATAPLESRGSCSEPDSCTLRGINLGFPVSSPSGWVSASFTPSLLGWAEPGGEDDPAPLDRWDPVGSRVSLTWPGGHSGSPEATEDLGLSCEDDAFAAVGLRQDMFGLVHDVGTEVRCESAWGTPVRIDVDWPDGPLSPGTWSVGDGGVGVQITLEGAGSGSGRTWVASSGDLTLYQRGAGRLELSLDLGMDDTGSTLSAAVQGVVSVPLLSRADTERDQEHLVASSIIGAFGRVLAPALGVERSFGPSGLGTPVLFPSGTDRPWQVVYVPTGTVFEVMSEARPGVRLALTSELVANIRREVRLKGNISPYPSALVSQVLYQVPDDLLDLIARNAGRDPSESSTTGTILGKVARWDPVGSRLLALPAHGKVTLIAPDGAYLHPTLSGERVFSSSTAPSATYAFLGLTPTTWDKPYILTVKDAMGMVINEYTQRIAPQAGTVSVIAWDAED